MYIHLDADKSIMMINPKTTHMLMRSCTTFNLNQVRLKL